MSTVTDQFAEILATAGVKCMYGVVGDSLNGTLALSPGAVEKIDEK